jgi:hypothetical protein
MNFADIENTWRSPHNRPDAAQLEKQKMEFIADLNRRRRGNLFFLGLIFSLLAFFTGKIVLHVLWPDPTLDRVNLAREWAIIPFFALPWIGWFLMVRLHWRNQVRHPGHDASISASVAALLDENQAERTRYKFIAGLLVASVLVLPVIVYQLQSVGKAGPEILIPALVLYPAYVVGVLIGAWFYHQRKLLPRKHQLEALLKSYKSEEI